MYFANGQKDRKVVDISASDQCTRFIGHGKSAEDMDKTPTFMRTRSSVELLEYLQYRLDFEKRLK